MIVIFAKRACLQILSPMHRLLGITQLRTHSCARKGHVILHIFDGVFRGRGLGL